MANDMKQLNVQAENGDFSFSLVDEEAREEAAKAVKSVNGYMPDSEGNVTLNLSGPIQYIESTDQSNLVNLRDLETGTYVMYGYFKPFAGCPNTLTFDKLMVNVVKKTAGTHVLVFSTLNSVVNFLSILVDSTKELGYSYERTNISLLDLHALLSKESGLPLPASAAVGQFIRVSAVDANGKVTATEAVTLENAGEVSF